MHEDIEWIISHVQAGDYLFRRHAAERASERGINPLDVKEALLNGDIIGVYHEMFRMRWCSSQNDGSCKNDPI